MRRLLITEPDLPYMSAWWPPGHVIGYEHSFTHETRDFLTAVAAGTDPALVVDRGDARSGDGDRLVIGGADTDRDRRDWTALRVCGGCEAVRPTGLVSSPARPDRRGTGGDRMPPTPADSRRLRTPSCAGRVGGAFTASGTPWCRSDA